MILKPEREADAKAVFTKWGLDFAVIGQTTDTGRMIITHNGNVEADLPVPVLANSAPMYERPWVEPKKPAKILPEWVPAPNSILGTLKELMGGPHLSSRRWIWEQYDHMVMGDTVGRPGGDAGVVRIHGTKKAHRRHVRCDTALRHRRPARGHEAGCRRDVAQLDRRRRRPTRDHRQHEFRESRAARNHGPVRRQRSRHGRSLPGARLPRRFGQRLALQRNQRHRHSADTRDRRRRPRSRFSEARRHPPEERRQYADLDRPRGRPPRAIASIRTSPPGNSKARRRPSISKRRSRPDASFAR